MRVLQQRVATLIAPLAGPRGAALAGGSAAAERVRAISFRFGGGGGGGGGGQFQAAKSADRSPESCAQLESIVLPRKSRVHCALLRSANPEVPAGRPLVGSIHPVQPIDPLGRPAAVAPAAGAALRRLQTPLSGADGAVRGGFGWRQLNWMRFPFGRAGRARTRSFGADEKRAPILPLGRPSGGGQVKASAGLLAAGCEEERAVGVGGSSMRPRIPPGERPDSPYLSKGQ